MARRKGRRLESLAEAKSPGQPRTGIEGYAEFALNKLKAAAGDAKIEINADEASSFIAVIKDEAGRQDLPSDPAKAILKIIDERLSLLQACATQTVEHWRDHAERAASLLAMSTIDPTEFAAAFASGLTKGERASILRRWFPIAGAKLSETERALHRGNLLRIARDLFGGLLPATGQESGRFGQFFEKRYLECGPFSALDAYLVPHRDAVGATLTLYLLASGSNISVGRTLTVDSFEGSDLKDHTRITGYKARAQGRPIIVDLPSSSPAVVAMKWLAQATERVRAHAPNDADMLFLQRIAGRCQLMTPHWYSNWFKEFAAKATSRSDIRMVPSMIRPSVLLKASLEEDGRLRTGMAIGQHTTQVAQGYMNKWPTRLVYDEHIRRFQASIETLIARNIDAAAEKFGIPVAEFAARLGTLQDTGLGVFCADHNGRPGNSGRACSTLDCWNDCPQLLIIAEREAMATLQLWRRSLQDAQPEWERDRPERWEAVWLPWLCLIDVVEEKMVRGPNLPVWSAATKRVAEIEADPNYVPPKPW